MARTRQKRKAKRREEQLKATRRSAAAKEKAMNPAEQAVIDQAEALEVADELEEIEADGAQVQAAPEPAPAPAKERERPAREPRRREAKKPERRPQPKAERRPQPRQRGRVVNFMIQVWAELRRVQWPDRNQVTQATGVVIVFCFLAGAYLALWDYVFSKFVTWLV